MINHLSLLKTKDAFYSHYNLNQLIKFVNQRVLDFDEIH